MKSKKRLKSEANREMSAHHVPPHIASGLLRKFGSPVQKYPKGFGPLTPSSAKNPAESKSTTIASEESTIR